MSTGITRAPVYPEIPTGRLSDAQAESLAAFQDVRGHLELVTEIFGLDTDEPYRLGDADLKARVSQQEFARNMAYRYSRGAAELGIFVMATVSQLEDELRRQTFLDIGCGYGKFGEDMARKAKAEVTFVDRDSESLARISKRAGNIVLADATDLPFADESFQKVLSSFSGLHWAQTPEESVKALNEAVRVTEVGGSTILIPVLNGITARRYLLPAIFEERQPNSEFMEMDRYAVTWAMQDWALINSLFRLAKDGHSDITWSNRVENLGVTGVIRELYSVIIDKKEAVPSELLAKNLEEARALVS